MGLCVLFLGYYLELMMELSDWRWLAATILCLLGIAGIYFPQHMGWIESTEFSSKPPEGEWTEDFLLKLKENVREYRMEILESDQPYGYWLNLVLVFLIVN